MFARIILLWASLLAGTSTLQAAAVVPDFEVATERGYLVRIYSDPSPLQLNRLHSWSIELLENDGSPISGAGIVLGGGMPDHDHGLPTLPRVTGERAPGVYLLQGLRFHMPGRWRLVIAIDNRDEAIIEFSL